MDDLFVIDSGRPGPHVLIIAGVHGDEFEPMLSVLDLSVLLPDILINGKVTCCHLVNKDAYANDGRCAADGLDLARVCPGKVSGTSTEVTAHHISKLIENSDYLLDMHTGGLAYDIYPMIGYMLHGSAEVLKIQREMAVASGMPLIWGTDRKPDGRTLSVARDAYIPAVYFEYGGGTGFRNEVVLTYKEATVNILNYLGMMERPAVEVTENWNYWLEDFGNDSGYLQGKMPSPAEGIFVSDVNVGDCIRKGQTIGYVIDPLTRQQQTVIAECSGLVFLKRMLVKVRQGDALGGVLPVELFKKKVIDEG